jgi:hypothetical protein
MSLPIGLGIVTDPSQITGVTQFPTCRNEDTTKVSRANESWLDWEGEYEDETDQNHCLAEEETGVSFPDSVTVPPCQEGEDTTNDVTTGLGGSRAQNGRLTRGQSGVGRSRLGIPSESRSSGTGKRI